jgi:excisionase family DNA binding protein
VPLTMKEAAERMGISTSLLYTLCRERRIEHIRIGVRGRRGKVLIEPNAVDSFLRDATVRPEAPLSPVALKHIRPAR